MTATLERGTHFDAVELDLLATHAGVRFPFPLRVPSFGREADERDALLAGAGQTLCARGLATGHGPLGIAGELVNALREYRSAVDLVVVGAGAATGAVAMVYGAWAVVCRQSVDEPGPVRVTRVAAGALSSELARLLPEVPPAQVMPITLPPGVVGDTLRLLGRTPETPATRRYVRELIRTCGGDESAVDQLVGLFPTVAGRGQLGAVHRSGTRIREVSWLDSPRGRVRVSQDHDDWVSINPLRHNELVRALDELAALARA